MRPPDPLRPRPTPPLQSEPRSPPPDSRALAGATFALMLLVLFGVLFRILGLLP